MSGPGNQESLLPSDSRLSIEEENANNSESSSDEDERLGLRYRRCCSDRTGGEYIAATMITTLASPLDATSIPAGFASALTVLTVSKFQQRNANAKPLHHLEKMTGLKVKPPRLAEKMSFWKPVACIGLAAASGGAAAYAIAGKAAITSGIFTGTTVSGLATACYYNRDATQQVQEEQRLLNEYKLQ